MDKVTLINQIKILYKLLGAHIRVIAPAGITTLSEGGRCGGKPLVALCLI